MQQAANAEAIEAWNGVLFDKFTRFRHLMTQGLGSHGTVAIERHSPEQGNRVLDVGCGFGDSTIELARRVGSNGEAVGVDAAARFIEAAKSDAAAAGVANARFVVADVQFDDLAGPYDKAYSRFGTMFFGSPVAALRNVRRALKKGGTLAMVVWRKREDNTFMHAAELRVREIVPEPETTDEPTCGPGPFSMASADLVSDQLRASGFDSICFERIDTDIWIGRDIDDAIAFAMSLGPAGEILRLAGAEAERLKPRVVEAIREALSPFVREDGVWAPSSSWLVSAKAL
jgi:ubiquinone/menaquinone biosynthesis C-methylase UbiE